MCSPADRPIHSLEEIKGKYELISKIGEGSFSSVFKAFPVDDPEEVVALKRIFPISSPARIENEIKHLVTLGGRSFVAPLLGGLRVKDQVTLIFPYLEHPEFKDYYKTIEIEQISYYMHCLLTALAWIHDNDIIHRDIKPSNCLFSLDPMRFMLIDFGLAQTSQQAGEDRKKRRPEDQSDGGGPKVTIRSPNDHDPVPERTPVVEPVTLLSRTLARTSLDPRIAFTSSGEDASQRGAWRSSSASIRQTAARAGTRGFRAPEILMKSLFQTSAIDVWSAGVILLSFLSARYPFFLSPDDLTGLAEITALFGSEPIQQLAETLGKKIHLREPIPPNDLRDVCRKLNPEVEFPPEAYDLLIDLLTLDPSKRITARQALKHSFFESCPPFAAWV